MFVLVTGATGYVGGRLVPRTAPPGPPGPHDGQRQREPGRALVGRPGRRSPWTSWKPTRSAPGVDTAYFLIHGMGGDDFMEQDRVAATNMRDAVAAQEVVSRVVYLSGIIPEVPEAELSEHLQSGWKWSGSSPTLRPP